jgi:DNA-binding NtrC family response regulator
MILHPGSRFRLGTVEIQLELDTQSHVPRATDEVDSYADLIGVSAAMRKLFGQLVRLEGSTVNVLIRGESGSGKELIARAIHEHSFVSEGPLVTVNCGALDRNLVRSELFGHSRGAFTGATERRTGAFDAADGGTLFLDEIGELPLDVQPILLRALETRTITPVGTHVERPVNVRLIAATHKDLIAETRAGAFREDLLYRVRVVSVEVPPLRERLEDIPALAHAFARRQGAAPLPIDFIDALANHAWPGNVRELRNAVEAYLAIGDVPSGTVVTDAASAQALDLALAAFVDRTRSYADQKAEISRRFSEIYVRLLLQHTGGNQSQAARLCGLERRHLGRLIDKLGLKPS